MIAMIRLIGFEKEELIGKTCKILNCDTCDETGFDDKDHYCALFKDGKIRRCVCTLQKKDGSPLYVMKNATVLLDKEGEIIGGVETLSDLSETMAKETIITDRRRELNKTDRFHGINRQFSNHATGFQH